MVKQPSPKSPKRKKPSYKKKFGQHHLKSGELCRPLIDFLRPEGCSVVEIGPGGGVLTAELVSAGAQVLALEVDLPWAFHLRKTIPSKDLRVAVIDAQKFPWQRLGVPTLITGNLPFNVGTRLVEQTLEAAAREPEKFPRLGYMLQQEVADRLTARPGEKAYGALTVLVRALADPVPLGTLSPGAFRPPPKVSAAFVGLTPRTPAVPFEHWSDFRKLVHGAFAQRRKTLRNSLGSTLGKEETGMLLDAVDLDPRIRGEALALADFVSLFEAFLLHKSSTKAD